jgi:hypothetical protein
MSNLLLTGTAKTVRAACAAALGAALTLGGCATQPDYVKPTATTATVVRPSQSAPGEAARETGDRLAAPSARE